jgi:hypothetical protein
LPPSCPPCPAIAPNPGDPCDADIQCEYGTDPRLGCNEIARCVLAQPCFGDGGVPCWETHPAAVSPMCGPVVIGGPCVPGCIATPTLACLNDGVVCPPQSSPDSTNCLAIRSAALGCPCTENGAVMDDMECVNGRFVTPQPIYMH